ncbi:hypothetical protein [Ralstonia phage RP13]|nr:hypothetical protein [Ralstonia phage RP13]
MSANTYWDHAGKYQAEYEQLHAALIPAMGNCETMEGEYLRAAARIYHDLYNNGFGNNWSGAWNFLYQNAELIGINKDHLGDIGHYKCGQVYHHSGDTRDSTAAIAIESITDSVILFIINKNGQYTPSNGVDMFDLQEPDDLYEEDEDDEDFED